MSLPTRMSVRARVEWNGREDAAKGGVRTVNLDGLDLGGVVTAVKASRAARRSREAARPLSTYRRVSFDAQVRHLAKTRAGRAKLDAIAKPVTWKGWRVGKPTTKRNRERVAQAYRDLATAPVRRAEATAANAAHEVAEALNRAVSRRYGAQVRFRDIEHMSFS